MTPKSVQEEIRQTRPFRSKSQEGVVALMRTADRVRRYFSRVVEPYGITLPQYNVLRILRGARGEGLPTLEIGERLIEEAPGITRMMDRLAAKGLVRRERSTEDRRLVVNYLTPEGAEVVDALDVPMDRADDEALGALSQKDLRVLVALLDRVRDLIDG